jgi:ubiquinone biosynthesis protein COQ4
MGELIGRGDATMLRRMRASETGRRLLDARHDILEVVTDRAALRAMPEGSLGREYVRFADTKQFFPEVLAASTREARCESGGLVPNATPEAAYLHDRYRDLHDLWHVAIGYDTDMAGEWGLVAFQTKQAGYRSMMLMASIGCFLTAMKGRFDLFGVWLDGRRRGKRAANLLAQDWERLLPMPLESVRKQLGLNPPPVYRPYDCPESAKAAARG